MLQFALPKACLERQWGSIFSAASAPERMNERDTFEMAIRPHLDRLYRLAYRLAGSQSDGQDLVQDVLIKLYSRRAELSSIQDLGPWLGRVLYNRFVDDQRRYRARRLRLVSTTAEGASVVEQVASEAPGPRGEAERSVDITRVQEGLAKLSQEHRTVLLLHDAEGYKISEIQSVTGIPAGTVKSRLHRARARLREILEADGTF